MLINWGIVRSGSRQLFNTITRCNYTIARQLLANMRKVNSLKTFAVMQHLHVKKSFHLKYSLSIADVKLSKYGRTKDSDKFSSVQLIPRYETITSLLFSLYNVAHNEETPVNLPAQRLQVRC